MNRKASLLFGPWAAAIAVTPDPAAKAVLAAPAALLPLTWWTALKPARWLTLFFAAALLLPPLPIAIGDSGPHPCLLIAALGLFIGLLYRWNATSLLPPVGLPLFALTSVLLSSVALAAIHSGISAAGGSLARVALFGISVYVFLYTTQGPAREEPAARDLARVYWFAAASALFACIDFYYQFPAPAGYGPQYVWLDSGIYRRAQGLFYEASTLGNFCVFFLVMIAVAWSRPREESPVSRKWLAAGGAIFFAALVLSYSRGSLINLLIAGLVLAWVNRRRLHLARALPILTAAILAGAWLTWKVFPAFAEMYWTRLSVSTEFFFSATEGVLSGRVESWRTLLDWIAANPWQTLLGIGYKTLPYTNYLGAPVVADNMYLSLLVETGIVGLAALLWLNVAILRSAARAARSPDPLRGFCGTWMLCFWAGEVVQMASGDLLTYWRVLPVYFWVLALAVRL
jgi:hypothetical protein